MNKLTGSFIAVWAALALFAAPALAADHASFPRVETETFDKEDFVFPDDLPATGDQLLFLSMANDREGGESQGRALLEWHAALEGAGLIPEAATPWHLGVMNSPPFFVKGMIRRNMRKTYDGIVPLAQAANLYVDDLDAFAQASGIELDGQPTIVVYRDGEVLEVLKGEVDEARVARLREVLLGSE